MNKIIYIIMGIMLIGMVQAETINISNLTTNNIQCEGNNLYCHSDTNIEGLVFYSPFEKGAYDWSNINEDGKVTSATYHENGVNNSGAYYFDTIGDNIQIEYNESTNLGNVSQTIIAWVNGSQGCGNKFIVASRNSSYGGGLTMSTSSTCTLYPYIGIKANTGYSTLRLNDSLWHQLALVYDTSANTLKHYVDGVLIATDTTLVSENVTNLNWIIGARWNVPGVSVTGIFNGSIDEVMIFNRSLSNEEIGLIYNQTYPKFYPTAFTNMTLNKTISTGYNRINITINNSNQVNTNLSLSIYNGTRWTDYTNITEEVYTYNISRTLSSINLSFIYNQDANKTKTPILLNEINYIIWNITDIVIIPKATRPCSNKTVYYDNKYLPRIKC